MHSSATLHAAVLVVVALIAAHSAAAAPTYQPIQGQYLVEFKPGLSQHERTSVVAKLMTADDSTRVLHQYQIGQFSGFAFSSGSRSLATRLAKHSSVLVVEQNVWVHGADLCATQKTATWNLNRVSTHPVELGKTYRYDYKGSGVDVYLIDTGIMTTHDEFRTPSGGSRAIWGANFVQDDPATDCNGHGTHVAGIAGGNVFGVAKNVTLIAVKVLSCRNRGGLDDIVAGVNWVHSQHMTRKRPAVTNLSIAGPRSSIFEDAVKALMQSGVTVTVSAGNENMDACLFSPAASPDVITVGSTGLLRDHASDIRSNFSNVGACVALFAPGSDIVSAGIESNSSTAIMSGTSMASPHVTGAAALLLDRFPKATPLQIRNLLFATATKSSISMDCSSTSPYLKACQASPNQLLYTSC